MNTSSSKSIADVSKRRWRIVVRAIEVVFVLVILCFAFLRLGNPQWHKYIYLFQAYISPGGELRWASFPPGFTGVWKSWYRNGTALRLDVRNGKKHGVLVVWHENGQKALEGQYEESKRVGIWTDWNENGSMRGQTTYRDGQRYGTQVSWYENGQKKSEGNYIDGKRDGKWTWWSEDGQISAEGMYKDGAPWEGRLEVRDESSWTYLFKNFKDGKEVAETEE